MGWMESYPEKLLETGSRNMVRVAASSDSSSPAINAWALMAAHVVGRSDSGSNVEVRLGRDLSGRLGDEVASSWSSNLSAELTRDQMMEIDRILDSEGPLLGLLRAQLAKIWRQGQVARQSGFFADTHERTLAAQTSQLEAELALAEQRFSSRVCDVLSANQRTGVEIASCVDGIIGAREKGRLVAAELPKPDDPASASPDI